MAIANYDLVAQISDRHGVDFDFAAEAVETYLVRMEDVDDRKIDRGAIAQDDADFIANAFASAQRHGNFGVPELDDVADAAEAADQAEVAAHDAMAARDRAIRHALARGARVVDVMAAAGVTRARIEQIRKGGR